MSTTKVQAPHTLSAETAAGVAQMLTPVVHNLIALSINVKQAHWHLRGANFIGVHEFLDQVQKHAIDAYDTAAERIIALGLPVDARFATAADKATNPTPAEGFQQYEECIAGVVEQIDASLEVIYRAINELDDIDLVSQDLVIAMAEQFDKDRWFLYSHIAQ